MGKTRAHSAALLLSCLGLVSACGGGSSSGISQPPPPPPPATVLDLATQATGNGFHRVYGSASTGRFGVPVASGADCDNDGLMDYAMSAMVAAPFGRTAAGQVHLVFGDGDLVGADIDTASTNSNVLTIAGAGPNEIAGSEIWIDDVTGDGIGDLLIGRQNYREPVSNRIGAGALSIVVGGSELRDLAMAGTTLDLAGVAGARVLTLIGANELDRFGFWFRTGDVTGDGIADVLVGADQEDSNGATNSGSAWLIRGGAHLDATADVDLADFGTTALAGHIARIEPPAGSANYHFGSTVALADLDNNLRAEVLVAASLARAGGQLEADGAPPGSAVRNGGNPGGSLFIFWDDNIPAGSMWPAGLTISANAPPAGFSRIDGGTVTGTFANLRLAEEMLGGLDYDGDGSADLFVGDIRGSGRGRSESGLGHVFFDAASLRGLAFSMDAVPSGVSVSTIIGIAAGTISADTSLHGDFNGDGIADLGISSPLGNPLGRVHAGIVHVLWGQPGPWPTVIDLLDSRRPANFDITDIYGARGQTSGDDLGDTLMYSAVGADIDNDGKTDLVINEMRGNGLAPTALDVGNLIIVSGGLVPR